MPAGPTIIAVPSSPGPAIRCLSLWNQADFANEPPPGGWTLPLFDDRAWPQAVSTAPAFGNNLWSGRTVYGGTAWFFGHGFMPVTERVLFRHHLPEFPGRIIDATLMIAADDECNGCYLNGSFIDGTVFTNLPGPVHPLHPPVTVSVTPALFAGPSQPNVLAVIGHNNWFYLAGVTYTLTVTVTAWIIRLTHAPGSDRVRYTVSAGRTGRVVHHG